MSEKFAFLQSNRFWAMVAFVAVLVAQDHGVLSIETASYLTTLLAGFIGIRTIDRFAEKSGSKDTGI
jgi:hypothetical protein